MIASLKKWVLSDKLLQHGALLMFAAVISHVCNIIYQMVMGRVLLETEYALLCTLLSFVNMAILPLEAISTAINHATSHLVQENREGDVSRLVRKWLLRMSGAGALILFLCLLFPEYIAEFMHLDRKAPVLIMGLIVFLIFSSSVISGATNGLQMFGVTSVGMQLFSIVRLVVGVLLIHIFVAAAGWGLLGHAIALGVNLTILFLFLWRRLHGMPKTNQPIPSIRAYVFCSFAILLGFSILLRVDIILVKHYFPDIAASFAYATTIGHIVIFLPMPLARAMFPKVATTGQGGAGEHRDVLMKSLLYTSVFIFPAAIGCSVLGWIPLRILYGIRDPSPELLQLVSAMAWIMFPVALINVIMYFNLAQKRFWKASPVVGAAVIYILGVVFFHESIWNLLGVAAISTWICLMSMVLPLFRNR